MRYLAILLLLPLAGCLKSGLPELGEVPRFELTASDGSHFGSEQLKGKIWVADFFFTTCNGPCPRMSAQMKKLQAATGAEIQLVSFTIDPGHDTPPVLAEYATHFRADPARWHFLTGTAAELQRLSMDTFHLGDIGVKLEHSTRFVLVDGKMRIRGYYESNMPGLIPDLTEDIAKLRKEWL